MCKEIKAIEKEIKTENRAKLLAEQLYLEGVEDLILS
jgi:hypothetical protein